MGLKETTLRDGFVDLLKAAFVPLHVNRRRYPTRLKFDYAYKANEAPFYIQSIYHDDKFTYIKTNAPEKLSVYEMKDDKPNLVTYDLREGTYIIPKITDSGYVELGKRRWNSRARDHCHDRERIYATHRAAA